MASTEVRMTMRVKSWIEPREAGWYCVAGFWWTSSAEEIGNDRRDCDDSLAVGPFPSRQVARRELRGDFRKAVSESLAELQRKGGKIVAAQFGQED